MLSYSQSKTQSKWFLPGGMFYRTAVACMAVLAVSAVIIISSLNRPLYEHGSFEATDKFVNTTAARGTQYYIGVAPETHSDETRLFADFVKNLPPTARALTVSATVASNNVFECTDPKTYGIYGFCMTEIEINTILSQNNASGYKKGDIITVITYISAKDKIMISASKGEQLTMQLYSSENGTPYDNSGIKIGFDNVWSLYNAHN